MLPFGVWGLWFMRWGLGTCKSRFRLGFGFETRETLSAGFVG